MPRYNAVESVRSAIEVWQQEAEQQLHKAEQSQREARHAADNFEQAVAALETQACPFCGGKMVDTSPLKPMMDKLGADWHFLYQGEIFGLFCQICQTYRTHPAHKGAERWTPDTTSLRSKILAAEVFQHFPQVEEICLEKGAGRNWLFRIGDEWFANELTKAEIKEHWGL